MSKKLAKVDILRYPDMVLKLIIALSLTCPVSTPISDTVADMTRMPP